MSKTIRFKDVMVMFWHGRRLVLWSVIAATVLGVVIALLLPLRYEAKVVFLPAETTDVRGGLGAFGGRLSDLADLAGLAGGATGDSEKSLAVLSSRDFTNRFLREEGVLQSLFPEQWDEKTQQWKVTEDGWFARFRKGLANIHHTDAAAERSEPGPTLWEGYRVFNRIRSVTRDRRTGLMTLSITWRDPNLAARWANRLVERVNEEMRARAIQDAERSVQYLSEQLQETNAIELRDVLFRLNESEQRKAMLAHVRRDFAFEVVDPAIVPKERVSPKRTLFVISSAFFGLLAGLIIVITRNILQSRDVRC